MKSQLEVINLVIHFLRNNTLLPTPILPILQRRYFSNGIEGDTEEKIPLIRCSSFCKTHLDDRVVSSSTSYAEVDQSLPSAPFVFRFRMLT